MRGIELSYAVRGRIILKFTSQLGVALAALTLVPLSISVYAGEYRISAAYTIVVGILLGLGALFARSPTPRRIQSNEAMVVASLAFVLSPLLMSIPMMVSGLPPIDAWFEAVSAITTTGLSTLGSVEGQPSTFLFARAWMQWYGGLGILALSLALFMQPGAVARGLYGGTGTDEGDLVGGTRAHARSVLSVYAGLTVAGVGLLVAVGLHPWTAFLHVFAAVSTGGFSTADDSLAGFGAPAQYAVTLLCFCGALPLTLYYTFVRRGWRRALADVQLRWLLVFAAATTAAIIALMIFVDGAPWAEAFYHGPLLALSAQTTAGFSSTPTAAHGAAVKVAALFAMFVGGASGSTAGGVKVLRIGILTGLVRIALQRSSMPRHAVHVLRLRNKKIEPTDVEKALVVVLVGGLTVAFSWMTFLVYDQPALDSLFEVVSATATVGLSTGLSAPELPAPLKMVLAVDMLLGRLEFVALLVLFYPRTWGGKRLEVE